MSNLVESLKRLSAQGKISNEKLEAMLDEGKITKDEFVYITNGKVILGESKSAEE